jgi:hypothetical protein
MESSCTGVQPRQAHALAMQPAPTVTRIDHRITSFEEEAAPAVAAW